MIFQSRPTTIGAIMVGMNRNGTMTRRKRMPRLRISAPIRPSMNSSGTAISTKMVATSMLFQKRGSLKSVCVVGEPGEVAHLPVTHLVHAQIKDVEERDQADDHERDHRGRDQEVGVPEAARPTTLRLAARHALAREPRSSSCHGPQAGGRRSRRRPRAIHSLKRAGIADREHLRLPLPHGLPGGELAEARPAARGRRARR